MTTPMPNAVPPKDDPACTCKKMRAVTTLDDGQVAPHWADLDKYCPTHGSKTAVPHDLERFPQALNSYACDPCQHGDHVGCQHEIRLPDWSHHCACDGVAQEAHAQVAREAKRAVVAEVIYAEGVDQIDFWLRTTDGTPNAASHAIAETLIEKGLIR